MKRRRARQERRARSRAQDTPAARAGFPLEVHSVAALLLVAAFVAYWPALDGGFLWDDDAHVTRPELRSLQRAVADLDGARRDAAVLPAAPQRLLARAPAVGQRRVGYHVVNVLLHALSACLLLLVLRRLRVPGAPLAAALFALHPVHVESVAWISEQKNTLSLVLYLGAALAYLRLRRDPKPVLLSDGVGPLRARACSPRRSWPRCRRRCWWSSGGAAGGSRWRRRRACRSCRGSRSGAAPGCSRRGSRPG